MRVFCLVVLVVIFISCGSGSEKLSDSQVAVDSTAVTSAPAAFQEKRDRTVKYFLKDPQLNEYQQFINELNIADIDNIQLATKKFRELFANSQKEICDTAIYLFEGFYSRVHYKIDDIHTADTTNYDSLVDAEASSSTRLSKKLTDYAARLSTNGFQVSMTEGITYIKKNRAYVEEHFYSYLTPLMVSFLTQLDKENREGFQEDGGLTIEPIALVDRIVWWEKFSQANPTFIFRQMPYDRQEVYTTTLITGEDNTPLYYEEGQPLDVFYKTAYDYLFEKYPESQTATFLRSYYTSLVRLDTAQIRKFRVIHLNRD
jgi:hypothetical protein